MLANNRPYINLALVYLLLFVSGAERYDVAADRNLVVVFALVLFVWYSLTDRRVNEKFLLYITVFVGLLVFLSIYTGGSLSVQSVIATTMKFMLAYLILSTVGSNFTETYIKVVVFLAAVSLFGYFTDIFNLFEGLISKLPRVGGQGFDMRGYEGIVYVFRHRFHLDRNNSIFFEPGAYQGFLNAALFMIIFTKNSLQLKTKWLYVTILITALLTAASTTGFIIFAILYALFMLRSDMATKFQKTVSAGFLIAVVGLFAVQFQSSVVDKLDGYLNPTEQRRGWSAENRRFDMITDLKIFKDHIFGLGYDNYKREFYRIGGFAADEHETSSNGVTGVFANYGLPYALFIFVSYYMALRYLLDDKLLSLAAYTMFIMFLWGEGYYQLAPISFAIIVGAFVYKKSDTKIGIPNERGATRSG